MTAMASLALSRSVLYRSSDAARRATNRESSIDCTIWLPIARANATESMVVTSVSVD